MNSLTPINHSTYLPMFKNPSSNLVGSLTSPFTLPFFSHGSPTQEQPIGKTRSIIFHV